MKKKFSKDYIQLTYQNEQNNNIDKCLLKKYKYKYKAKNTAECIPTKFKNFKNNIFSEYKNNITNKNKNFITNLFLDDIVNIKSSSNSNFYRRNSSIINMKQNPNNINLFNLVKDNIKNKNKLSNFLPNIHSLDYDLQRKTSFKLNNNIETYKKSKFFDNNIKNKANNKNKNKTKFSSGSVKLLDILGKDDINDKSSKNFRRKQTYLNIHKKINLMDINKINDNKIKEIEGKNGIAKEKKNQNPELLYSEKINNYIVKIFKSSEKKQIKNKNNSNNSITINNNKSKKKKNKNYLNDFDPKIYIEDIKRKLKYKNVGNFTKLKNKIIMKTKDYIEKFCIQESIINNSKRNILEKVKEENSLFISKVKKEYIKKLIHEILYKINFKHKNTIFKYYIDTLLISQYIYFHIHIKISIMKHVLNQSDTNYENIYFINLIKYLLYSGKKKLSLKYVNNLDDSFFYKDKNDSSNNKLIEFTNNKNHYLNFYIKFLIKDSETILNSYNINYTSEQKNFFQNEKSKKNLLLENKKRSSLRTRSSKRKKSIIKYIASSKLMKINLSKSIINLRNKSIEEAIKNKSILNVKNLKKIKDLKKICEYKSKDNDKESDALFNNNKLHKVNNKENAGDDNEEVHERDRKLLFENFFSFVEFSQFDKLFIWLSKCSKYMDLNYKLDNGDTLLHLCVKYSVPHYIITFLLSHGLNINSQNNEGDTALHLAVKSQKYKTIDLLIKLGASEYIYNKKHQNCWECL